MRIRARFALGALVASGAGAAFFGACSSPGNKAAISYCGPNSDPQVPCNTAGSNGTGTGGGNGLPTGLGVGEDCSGNKQDDCRPGLECVNDECEPAGTLAPGALCAIGAECTTGLCVASTCAPAGDGATGDACKTDADCEAGLRCGLNGFSAICVASGTADLGSACATHDDCYQGLYCKNQECVLPEPPLGIPLWEGVTCEDIDGPVRAYFEVPGADGADEGDFFRLPFPSDIRLKGTKPDLTGFPTPGPDLLGVDVVKSYVDKLETSGDRWSSNGSVIFRFSGDIDFATLKFEGDKRPVVMVDLTEREGNPPDDHVEPIGRLGVGWNGGGGRTKYVCDNWIAVRPGLGGVLKPNHTYAVWITNDAKDKDGNVIERSPNFAAMLADTAPSDAQLKVAYDKFAPLRAYLAENWDAESDMLKPIDPDTIINATVFTVGDTLKPMRDLAEAVADADAPEATDWVKCDDGVESPCPQADGNRACGSGAADYDEYQALIELPVFQKGTAPYLESGGAIDTAPVRTEQVCAALSVPKGTAPASGYPLVIYAHGTGGSFRSHLSDSVAGELARATPKFAVLGIDQVAHGPRRGSSMEEPDNLFFNFVNPDAARGNPLQGAADQLSLLRLAKSLGTVTVGSDSFEIDDTQIVFYGHSQGSTHGSLMLPYSDFPGAVFSGNGGSLVHALVNKTNPVNIAGAIPIVLQDMTPNGELAIGESHPVLTLLQQWIDAADPLNLAPLPLVRPDTGQTRKNVFQTFGLNDTYSPPETLAAYTYAAGLRLVSPPSGVNPTGDNKLGLTASNSVAGNYSSTSPDADFTGAVRQYAPPSGKDGHFVATDVQTATDDVVHFLEQLTQSGAPSVP